MRTLKETSSIVINEKEHLLKGVGLCGYLNYLAEYDFITEVERTLYFNFISKYKPVSQTDKDSCQNYWWDRDNSEVRIQFIKYIDTLIIDVPDYSLLTEDNWCCVRSKFEWFIKGTLENNIGYNLSTARMYVNVRVDKADIKKIERCTPEQIEVVKNAHPEYFGVTWESLKNIEGHFLTKYSGISKKKKILKTSLENKNVFPEKYQCKQVLAKAQLLQIAKKLNGCSQRELDYNSGDVSSVIANRSMDRIGVFTNTNKYSPYVSFKTAVLAEECLRENRQLFINLYGIE